MPTVARSTRADSMSGYSMHSNNSRMQSPSSEYSYTQDMSANSSGMFSFSQTGPSVDPSGSAWGSTTAEGPQNFFADQGDAEEFNFTMDQFSGRSPTEITDEFQSTWPTAAAFGGVKTHKAEPMRRVSSKGSSASYRITKPSSIKENRLSLQTSMSHSSLLQASNYELTGNASTMPDGLSGNGPAMDPSQFMFQQPNGIITVTSPEMMYARMDGFSGTPSVFNDFASHHVDPSTITLDFDTSRSGGSPAESFESYSEVTTPPREDAWTMNMHNSPMTSISSHSPAVPTLDSFTMVGPLPSGGLESSMSTVVGDDQSQTTEWAGITSEGEARDHPLYKNAYPKADGLYHCPWEGEQCCAHRPEKLKCNYDKFVDSHLKPYRCKLDICRELKFSSTACLLRHEREAHGMHGHGTKPYPCTYAGCERAQPGNGFPRKWNLHDHMHRVHNAAPPPDEDGGKDAGKAKKRKNDMGARNTSGRKSPKSRKSSPKAEPQVIKVDPTIKMRDDWFSIQAGFPSLISGFDDPEDPMVMNYINRARENLESMARIHMDLMAAKNPAQYLQQSG